MVIRVKCKAGQMLEILSSKNRRIKIYILKTGGRYTRLGIDASREVKIEKRPYEERENNDVSSMA
jgi:sRNA-binding carbon storage regulator CsrA